MKIHNSGISAAAGESEQQRFRIPWEEILVSGVLLTGWSLLIREAFPSIGLSAAVLSVIACLLAVGFFFLYQSKAGNWILPAALLLLLLLGLICGRQVLSGFSCIGNDALQLMTEQTGRIYLEFSAAAEQNLPWALLYLLSVPALLFSRSLWNGKILLSLPILLPAYAAALTGLVPCGIGCGLMIAGTGLLLFRRIGGLPGASMRALRGAPLQLLLPVLCALVCIPIAAAVQGDSDTGIRAALQKKLHESRYDSETNSMPEGDLKNLTAWQKSDTPALELTMEQPEKLYLRGQVYETYTGTAWESADTKETASYGDLFYWLHESGFYGQSQIALASETADTVTPYTMTVKNLSACSAHGYAPYALAGDTLSDAARIGDAAFTEGETMQYLVGSVPEWYEVQQSLAAEQDKDEAEDYLSLEQAYEEYVKQFDLQMSQESYAAIRRQLNLDDQSRTIGEIRSIIYQYLAQALIYDETVNTVNGSGDFLSYTLEQSGRGYSVHYATAAVLMLRYLGVPARYVEGYFLSAEEAAAYEAGETIVLTEENAHAWAEYYVSGVGFVPFEVTPGYIDDEDLEIGGEADHGSTYQSNPQQLADVQQPEETEEQQTDRLSVSLNAGLILLLIPLAVVLLLVLILLRRRKLKRALAAIDAADDRNAIAMRYGYADCLLQHCTVDPPEGAAEAAALNIEAMYSLHEMTPEQRASVDAYAGRVLEACRKTWSWHQKLRYRLWECLY